MDVTPQVIIGIVTIIGFAGFFCIAVWKLGSLARDNEQARDAFLKFLNPMFIVILLMLLGVLFLLTMAILDLDKGRVLIGMGKTAYARGLITYLFVLVTIGTAIVLVLSALLGIDKEKFDNGKEVLGLLLGVFGTIVGFYFASELSTSEDRGRLMASPILLSSQEVAPSQILTVTVSVRGGTPPYTFAVAIGADLPDEYFELVRSDGWIVKSLEVPANEGIGIQPIRVGIRDSAGESTTIQSSALITTSSTG